MIRLEKICYAYEKEVALKICEPSSRKRRFPGDSGTKWLWKIHFNQIIKWDSFPSEGSYHFQGHEITEKALKNNQFAKWFHQQMGYVFQNADTQLFCGSVEEEVAFGPIQMGLSETEVKKKE